MNELIKFYVYEHIPNVKCQQLKVKYNDKSCCIPVKVWGGPQALDEAVDVAFAPMLWLCLGWQRQAAFIANIKGTSKY